MWRSIALLALVATATTVAADEEVSYSPLRVWIDSGVFAKGETDILKEAIANSNNSAVLAGESKGGQLAEKGFHDLSRFDMYWTGREVRGQRE